jgi:predicted dehydrogenase
VSLTADGYRPDRIRVVVVGGGFVSQVVHLPSLRVLDDYFELVGLAEPSEKVRTRVASLYGIDRVADDYRKLIECSLADAVIVCSPNSTHAEVVLAALEAGLHVFVEKPLCITIEDADEIIAARDRTDRIVQVGYMKRFDPAYELMLDALPRSGSELLLIDAVTCDPGLPRFFGDADFVRPDDLVADVVDRVRQLEVEQVTAAVGADSPAAIDVFSRVFLGALIHDVNLVHGALQQMGEPVPAPVAAAAWRPDRSAASAHIQLDGGTWRTSWLEVPGINAFRERIEFFFPHSVHSLAFPAPYLRRSPGRYERLSGRGEMRSTESFASHADPYLEELRHFHECVVGDVACRTPPELARVDLSALVAMFLAAERQMQDPIGPRDWGTVP